MKTYGHLRDAWWLTLRGADEPRDWDLVHRALAYLPIGPKTIRPLEGADMLVAGATAEMAAEVRCRWPAGQLGQALVAAESHTHWLVPHGGRTRRIAGGSSFGYAGPQSKTRSPAVGIEPGVRHCPDQGEDLDVTVEDGRPIRRCRRMVRVDDREQESGCLLSIRSPEA